MAHITKTEERRQTIRELISRDGSVRVGELSKELGVTAVTIRSDLAALEEEGFLQRMNGGAIMT
ncbi:MAG: DeoR/GlpR transcriptional regulator, partial [Spirochaetales bacterium]|nr:DeoR/GlpR transcriptional regulator [Spirochaetales bacterium]